MLKVEKLNVHYGVIHALKDVLKEQGITFSICVTDGMEELEEKYLTSYIIQNVNGIIIEGCSSAEFIQKQMRTTSIPVLFLNEDKEQLNCCCLHEVQAGEVLGAYMLKKQQLVVRYLGVDQMIADQRLQGIRNCYHENGSPSSQGDSLYWQLCGYLMKKNKVKS